MNSFMFNVSIENLDKGHFQQRWALFQHYLSSIQFLISFLDLARMLVDSSSSFPFWRSLKNILSPGLLHAKISSQISFISPHTLMDSLFNDAGAMPSKPVHANLRTRNATKSHFIHQFFPFSKIYRIMLILYLCTRASDFLNFPFVFAQRILWSTPYETK